MQYSKISMLYWKRTRGHRHEEKQITCERSKSDRKSQRKGGKGRTKLKACESWDNQLSLRHLILRLSPSASCCIFPHLSVSPNNRIPETTPSVTVVFNWSSEFIIKTVPKTCRQHASCHYLQIALTFLHITLCIEKHHAANSEFFPFPIRFIGEEGDYKSWLFTLAGLSCC